MQQHELRPPRGAKKNRRRVGRGNASGHGTYSGRGVKGQQSRSGYKTRPFFEGGQTPLIRRLPHRRGFRNPFRVEYVPISLNDLARVDGDQVTPESLRDAGIIRSLKKPIKILADGDLSGPVTVRVHRVSASARAKIEAAGGTVEELTPRKDPEQKRQRGKKKSAAPEAKATAEDSSDEEATSTDEASEDEASESEMASQDKEPDGK
ncbi:MAG: 50S ribosomal protein L15 [Chloroflexi bacterium]|nr:50S ribosomal protein L15 [Chloroflexota bacterium]